MSSAAIPTGPWNLRLWPGLVLVAAVAFFLFVPIRIVPQSMLHFIGFFAAPGLGAVLAVLWWTTYARTSRPERVWVPLLFILPAFVVAVLDLARGDVPMLAIIFGPALVLALWVGWLTISLPFEKRFRLTGAGVLMALGWAAVVAVRVDGTPADMWPHLTWRWSPRAEDAVADELNARPLQKAATTLAQSAKTDLDWPQFRGPNRDGVLTGVKIDPDWAKNPPKLLWKQKIAPGWGSFAAVGDRLFTQEQRGDDEAVVCYDAGTGAELWRHFEKAKHHDVNAQAGPRATPTVADGRVYAQGATGLLVCLNAEDGKLLWTTDIKVGTGGKVPQWGYSGSPLVLNGLVVVYTGGPEGKGTSAFRAADGTLAWSAGQALHGYSSAHRVVIAGVEQVLMLSDYGLEAFEPTTGTVLWDFAWTIRGLNRVTQPTVIGEGEFLIGTGVGSLGTKRLKVTRAGDRWTVAEVWFTRKVHPYFNDGVAHDGHFYGYASKSLVCVSLMDGSVKWDAGTIYGEGQVLLLKDCGLLVVQAVGGPVYLVKATPDDHIEEAKLDALAGKMTWNHPVVNRGRLYVRNGEWAAAFQLTTK